MIIIIPLIAHIIILVVDASIPLRPYSYIVIYLLLRTCEIAIVICLLNVIAKSSSSSESSTFSGTKEKEASASVTIEMNSGVNK